ncbi:major capsid protein [Rhizobium sp. RU36D]|uniref:major capsid protein n=1 Tax=Rhizobium sp. RU36D TaxID=1907415 RepID=UPI0009D84572|nr:major capsid protein [Rhizobium sp. RU36D]SMD18156.1 Phage major capsid protein E [Rhizobium sp. RU36D]
MPEIIFPYTNVDLTTEVNRIPNTFGLLNALNIAPSEPKRSRLVRIDFREGQVHVLSHQEPGAPGEISSDDNPQEGVILSIPHFTHFENILVGDIDGMLEVINGVVTEKSLDAELARKLAIIRKNHAITREFLRLGMLRGEIKDGKLRTLYNLYDVFGITKKTVDFTLGTAGTNVREKCEEVSDHIISSVKGETVGTVEALVDGKFFGKLISHPNVEKFWVQAQNSGLHTQLERQRLGGNWGRVFEFGDIIWREYKGSLPVKNNDGTISNVKNVADNSGNAYPSGTQSMFRTFDAPAYHIDRVNQAPSSEGEEGAIFISYKELDHGMGIELKSQTNALAVCKQPDTIVEVVSSN